MPLVKQLENFNFLEAIDDKSGLPKFSHALNLYEKEKNKQRWYVKYLDSNIDEAIKEVIAQEFFRLILPYHPKTRLIEEQVLEGADPNYYVISKAVTIDDHFFFRPNYIEEILQGNVKGLGAAQVVALWLNEIDFKAGNVVLNKEGQVIKLDGGLCFSEDNNEVPGKTNFDITEKDLEALPLLSTYTPYNWLDYISHKNSLRITNSACPLFNSANEISASDHFKQEIYQTILRILCLPQELIAYFVTCYIATTEFSCQLTETILKRQQQLKEAAYQIISFTEYMKSKQMEYDLIEFVQTLKTFKTMRNSVLLTDIRVYRAIDTVEKIFEKNINGYAAILAFYRFLCKIEIKENLDNEELKLVVKDYLAKPTKVAQYAVCANFLEVKERAQDKFFLVTLEKLIAQLDYITKITSQPKPQNTLDSKSSFFKRKARAHRVTLEEALRALPNSKPH